MTTTSAKPLFPKQWDTLGSTYRWVIHLDRSQSQNIVDTMTGYSKKWGYDEARDKRQLLMRIVVRLYNSGWLGKATGIEFYQRAGEVVNKKTDPCICIIRRSGVECSPDTLRDAQLVQFFQKFFDYVREGKDVAHLLPPVKNNFTKDDYLNPEKQHARIGFDEMRLNAYCSRLMNNGHAFEAMMRFYHAYKEKYFRGGLPSESAEINYMNKNLAEKFSARS